MEEVAKGIAASLSTKNVVEAMVLENGGMKVHCEGAVYQDVCNHMENEGFGGVRAGKGVLLTKAPEGVCCIVTTQTEGFIAFGGVEFKGVISIETVTHCKLDTSGPVLTVEGLEQSRCVRREAVAIGLVKGDIGNVDGPRQVMVVVPPALEDSILARDR